MLVLGKHGKITFDGEHLDPSNVNMEEFFMANLSMKTTFEDGLTVEELLNFFSPLRKFIYSYTSEHYDALKALITTKSTGRRYKNVRVFKKLVIEDGYMHFIPSLDFIRFTDINDIRCDFLSEVPVVIGETVPIIEEDVKEGDGIKGVYKSNKTLQEIIDAMFDDLIDSLREGLI